MAHILIVDDTAPVRFALSTVLQEHGHQTAESADGQQALDSLASRAFDIVVTDIFMPEIDGIELITRLREERPDMKIIAISGGGARFVPSFAINLAHHMGADIALQKPVNSEELLSAVQALS